MNPTDKLFERVDGLLVRLEKLLPGEPAPTAWKDSIAFRWRKRNGHGAIVSVGHVHKISLADLRGIDRQKKTVEQNTQQFVEGYPANNVLLTGARGTGKSSLIKALLNKYAPRGPARDRSRQAGPDRSARHRRTDRRARRALHLFCDDLSFEADEPGYKALKVVLDGSVAAASENCLIYATSNRRHLMPEYMSENLEAKPVGDEIHPGETVEEKISLSERFGVWVSFYPFDQDEYLEIVAPLAAVTSRSLAPTGEAVRQAALQWALQRGSRSGRVAWQFARDWAGRARAARGK